MIFQESETVEVKYIVLETSFIKSIHFPEESHGYCGV